MHINIAIDILDIIEFKSEKAFNIVIDSAAKNSEEIFFTEYAIDTINDFFKTIYTNIKNIINKIIDTIAKLFEDANINKKIKTLENSVTDHPSFANEKIKNGVPLVTARNVRMGYLDYSVRDFISYEEYMSYLRSGEDDDDIEYDVEDINED